METEEDSEGYESESIAELIISAEDDGRHEFRTKFENAGLSEALLPMIEENSREDDSRSSRSESPGGASVHASVDSRASRSGGQGGQAGWQNSGGGDGRPVEGGGASEDGTPRRRKRLERPLVVGPKEEWNITVDSGEQSAVVEPNLRYGNSGPGNVAYAGAAEAGGDSSSDDPRNDSNHEEAGIVSNKPVAKPKAHKTQSIPGSPKRCLPFDSKSPARSPVNKSSSPKKSTRRSPLTLTRFKRTTLSMPASSNAALALASLSFDDSAMESSNAAFD